MINDRASVMETALPTDIKADGLSKAIANSGTAAVKAAEAMTQGVAAAMEKLEHELDASVPLAVQYEEPNLPEVPEGKRRVAVEYEDTRNFAPMRLDDQTVRISYVVEDLTAALTQNSEDAVKAVNAAYDQIANRAGQMAESLQGIIPEAIDPAAISQSLEGHISKAAETLRAFQAEASEAFHVPVEAPDLEMPIPEDRQIGITYAVEDISDVLAENADRAVTMAESVTTRLSDIMHRLGDAVKSIFSEGISLDSVSDTLSQFATGAIDAIRSTRKELEQAMHGFADTVRDVVPSEINVDTNIRSAVQTVSAAVPGVQSNGRLSLTLNISTFNNYSSEDIQHLTNEIMVTAGQFAKRKGVVYA